MPDVIHNVPPGVWVEAAELRAPGRHIADRLDVMGVNAAQVLAGLDRRIKIGTGPFDEVFLTEESEYSIAEIREEEALLGAMSAQDWSIGWQPHLVIQMQPPIGLLVPADGC